MHGTGLCMACHLHDKVLCMVFGMTFNTLDFQSNESWLASLWQLCQWQAALSGTTDQACSLSSPEVMHA